MEKEEAFLVTDDKWIRVEGGDLDFTDRQILKEVSQDGRVCIRVITSQEMFEALKREEPRKFRKFKTEMEKQFGKSLTLDQIVELSHSADDTAKEFNTTVASMTLGQATQVRYWRIEKHKTWRSIARSAYLAKWFDQQWFPLSNQPMGMALCERAAKFFSENYKQEPWN